MRKMVNGKIVVMTEEEIERKRISEEAFGRKVALMERSRPLTAEEVSRMLIEQQVNTLDVDHNTALRMKEFYPEWVVGVAYPVSFKVRRGDGLWRCRQDHTSQVDWEPERAASLWEQICESHDGSLDDPIPYSGNMALEEGKYYHQEFVIYRCFRDTGIPVYNALGELVGLYMEVIS